MIRAPTAQKNFTRLLFSLACVVLWLGRAEAKAAPGEGSLLSVEEALHLVFGSAAIEKQTFYLTEAQVRQVGQRSGYALQNAVQRPCVARDPGGKLIGVAYFETHRVRAQRETLMVAVDGNGALIRVEVLAFHEPKQYLPRAAFYDQFRGLQLSPELELDRGLRNVSGATLSAKAATRAARQYLALHGLLFDPAPKDPQADLGPQQAAPPRRCLRPDLARWQALGLRRLEKQAQLPQSDPPQSAGSRP